jgi:hypothetical protein
MSSYFDEMGRRIYETEQAKDLEKTRKLLDQVKQQVGNYLAWIETNALKSEKEKIFQLKSKYEAIVNKGTRYGAYLFVSGDMHELGHDIGRARIKLHGGRICGDNPYYPGHYEEEY